MDEGSQPQPLSASMGMHPQGNQQRHPRSTGGGMPGQAGYNLQNELLFIKQDAAQVRNAVILLEQEKDSLRKAIRKLKLENGRMKLKVKALQETMAELTGTSKENGSNGGAAEAELDYDDIGRDFFLIGGVHDPLSLRYEVAIRDSEGVEHKSAERFYWYKMAETFGDNEAMKKILQAPNVNAAEDAMKEIQNFDEDTWNKLKLTIWEEGQQLKLNQVRWIANLLVLSRITYIAVASQDKCFGTGWRKNRPESNKPIFWDGLNEGGKILMKIRQHLKDSHSWSGPYEEEETQRKFKELQRFVWRRIDPAKRLVSGGVPGRGMINRGPGRGVVPTQRRFQGSGASSSGFGNKYGGPQHS